MPKKTRKKSVGNLILVFENGKLAVAGTRLKKRATKKRATKKRATKKRATKKRATKKRATKRGAP
jgi:regulator of replication initiation timing